ncbi:uncharacterized protein EI97DRAFT_442180 [Westerdykella ornata]|uniref:Micro-fibrillar-associated protein 1 C-terminal domain-containing protein n=1 Tax=Westerdykella ornata TaxID=318751 RepID=A0A6A6JKQ8_WESOR|nr:uncharacterized protein EI97DRAFT_442180 [Westerdykella ornata]KAF2276815.1 hypothetical protein EI97DRAFT_442180 [Westerdykella ornata]
MWVSWLCRCYQSERRRKENGPTSSRPSADLLGSTVPNSKPSFGTVRGCPGGFEWSRAWKPEHVHPSQRQEGSCALPISRTVLGVTFTLSSSDANLNPRPSNIVLAIFRSNNLLKAPSSVTAKMPPKRMTAQPVRVRHFPGKPAAPEVEESSASESEPESEEEEQQQKPKPYVKPKPAPLASTFPRSALKSNLAARQKSEAERKQLEAEFETESEESEESGSESGSEEESSEDEEYTSSSEEETRPKFQRPVFLKKNQRKQTAELTADELAAEEEKKKQEKVNALVKEKIEERVAEQGQAAMDWNDDAEHAGMYDIDDTDDLDPEAEYAAWKLRELKRMKRERETIEQREAELAEIEAERERRENLTAAEREAEDRQREEQEKEERRQRGKMDYMQKYHHKGAFYQEELQQYGVDKRNIMAARFQDSTNREVLPEYMQIRDMTKLGKKGRTKYKDMRSEDTGTWGNYADDRRSRNKNHYGVDERFREGGSGANARPLGERKRHGADADPGEAKRPRVDSR